MTRRGALRRLDLRGVRGDLRGHVPRPAQPPVGPVEAVRAILDDVRRRGDEAIREYTERFDGVHVPDPRVAPEAVQMALRTLDPALRAALERAAANITAYHETQRGTAQRHERDGIVVRSYDLPVERAGCYAPGGRALYPSTVLMTAIPAKVAGVDAVVLCVPPDRHTGQAPPMLLAAAAIAGVDEVWRIGGAQAIGAMAYGTATLRPVDVIVGPGNVYVALAKREVAGQGVVGVPSAFAGPSEVVVIVDDSTPVPYAAVDVVLQAEHGPDGLAWLVTWSESVADAVDEAVDAVVASSPRRADLEATLGSQGFVALVDGPEQAVALANAIAPEHLELMTADPDALLAGVRHAGAVFCGPWAPASVGDYLAGPNHVLPTFGSARYSSALTVSDFTKHLHVVSLDRDALAGVAADVITLADAEGLPAHALSVRVRTEPLAGLAPSGVQP